MYKSIPQHFLNPALYDLHKEGAGESNFGMDGTQELIDGGFGLYSSVNTKRNIGPIKSEYFRIALVRSGTATYTIGLEVFQAQRNTIVFGVPGQVFSLQDTSDDFFVYYMLFSESFIADSFLLKDFRTQFPFMNYAGIQCFPLEEEQGGEVEVIVHKMNEEIKGRRQGMSQALKLYIHLLFIHAYRNYTDQLQARQSANDPATATFTRFLKLVSQHFLTYKKVADYAAMLYLSADHLNRIIKACSDKTAHEFIDEMIVMEAKAHLLHSTLSVAEIAYSLGFSDPSHFNKFFRKQTGGTPAQFRQKPESDH